jgi:Fe-S cluster assembly protein SufD
MNTALKIDEHNLPTPREEEWKYTNLPRAMPHDLKQGESREIVIHKNRGEICGKPEDILFTASEGELQTPQLKLVLEDGAQMTLIERHGGQGAYWKNMTTAIELGHNARLTHIRIQEDSAEAINTNMVKLTAARDAHYNGFTLNLGGKMTRHDIHATVQGENGALHFNGLNLLGGMQHGDTTILIEHQAPHCSSNQFYRSILNDSARCVFQGKVHVHKAAQKTNAYQLSNALLLSPKAEMDTKPELEIYADDVKCSHGATTGQLDEEPLFYLRARGLTEAQARMLLLEAFVDEVVEKVGDEAVKTDIKAKAKAWLAEVLA